MRLAKVLFAVAVVIGACRITTVGWGRFEENKYSQVIAGYSSEFDLTNNLYFEVLGSNASAEFLSERPFTMTCGSVIKHMIPIDFEDDGYHAYTDQTGAACYLAQTEDELQLVHVNTLQEHWSTVRVGTYSILATASYEMLGFFMTCLMVILVLCVVAVLLFD